MRSTQASSFYRPEREEAEKRIEETLDSIREEYYAKMTTLQKDLTQQQLLSCHMSQELVEAEANYSCLRRNLENQVEANLVINLKHF